jgi:hypothetical protein
LNLGQVISFTNLIVNEVSKFVMKQFVMKSVTICIEVSNFVLKSVTICN